MEKPSSPKDKQHQAALENADTNADRDESNTIETNSTHGPVANHDNKRLTLIAIIAVSAVVIVAIIALLLGRDHHSYEQYDLKGLTVKAACEKARGAGWKVEGAVAIEGDDKTDCYNEEKIVTDYYYYEYDKSATIYFGEKKTEAQKQAECEAQGKWYRDGSCKSQEEWETHYQWQNAHAACKKYGASAYAKTLTDCYLGNDYVGTVDGEPQAESAPEVQETPAEPSSPAPTPSQDSPSSSTPTSSGTYESIYNEYAARLRAECPSLSMMECAELSNEGVEKMAEYMWRASGKDGQYETYSEWATKLYDVYMAEAR